MNMLLHLLARLVHLAYWYCCDFMVNLANNAHVSYNEANTWVLLVGIPGLLALLIGVRVAQWFWLRRLRRQ
jgi:predicted signal transduction protein with EAL and GGDEF domain